MPKRALLLDLATGLPEASTVSRLQYLTANAVWDRSLVVSSDAARTLSFTGITGALSLIVHAANADITISGSANAILDGTVVSGQVALLWINADGTDGGIFSLL
jgi:hypothetical protein